MLSDNSSSVGVLRRCLPNAPATLLLAGSSASASRARASFCAEDFSPCFCECCSAIASPLRKRLLGYLPAFSLFGFLDGADAASSSAALPTFCRTSVACRTSERLFNLFAAPERGLCFFPSPVGG